MKPDRTILSLGLMPDAVLPAQPARLEATPVPGRILLVDDDPGVRGFLGEMLRRVEYHVSCAEDGEAGWDVLRADRFDVLITDHEMPRLSGLDLLRRVRAAPLDVPVILISGSMPWTEPDLLRLLPPGVALEKPFSFVDLLANIRTFLTPTIRTGPLGDRQTGGELRRPQSPLLGARVVG
jgi:DNA-binding response OmpR family regulator